MKTKKQLRSKVYYVDKHVHAILFHEISDACEHCFVKCKVIPSLPSANPRDKPDHDVWLCLSKVTGQVHSAECDCTAGNGEACNHVGALMYALSDLTMQKKEGKLASTSKKCVWAQFNNPRKRRLTPKKASDLKFRKCKLVTVSESTVNQHETTRKISKEFFESSVNEDTFRQKLVKCNPTAGWLLNFIETREVMEVPKFLIIDFNYHDNVDLNTTEMQNMFQLMTNDMKLNATACKNIEHLTRGQGSNILWAEERRTRITASNFGEILCMKSVTAPEGVLKRIMYSNFTNKYVIWGKKHEPAARMKYRLTMKKTYPDINVSECGLYVLGDCPYLGASPDGIVSYTDNDHKETGVLEVKCPASDKWKMKHSIECAKDPDFYASLNLETGVSNLKLTHKYYYQVQGQMAITGLQWCNFVIWTLSGISIERIPFDEECWLRMSVKLKEFYSAAVLPELFSRRVQRGHQLL